MDKGGTASIVRRRDEFGGGEYRRRVSVIGDWLHLTASAGSTQEGRRSCENAEQLC